MKITYRQVDINNSEEMQFIASIDMSIPALFDSEFEVNEKTIADRLEQLKKQFKENDFFEVAVAPDGKIVGFHFLNQKKTHNGLKAADIQTLWVDPQFRRQGIGRALKTRAEDWAQSQKLEYISTFVHSKNTSMLSLNKDLEYEVVGFRLKKTIT